MKHADQPRAKHSADGGRDAEMLLVDPRHPDAAYMQRELDRDRRHERVLITKALIAAAVVAVLVVIRQLYFV